MPGMSQREQRSVGPSSGGTREMRRRHAGQLENHDPATLPELTSSHTNPSPAVSASERNEPESADTHCDHQMAAVRCSIRLRPADP